MPVRTGMGAKPNAIVGWQAKFECDNGHVETYDVDPP